MNSKEEVDDFSLNDQTPNYEIGSNPTPSLTQTSADDVIEDDSKQTERSETSYIFTGEELLNMNLEEVPCLVEPIINQAGLVCLAGSSDTGKSTLLRQLALAIATGEAEFLGFKINAKHNQALYVSTEDLARETSYLLKKQAKNYKAEDLKNITFIFDSDDLLIKLESELIKQPRDITIIDCFSDVFTYDIKDSQKIRNFLHPYHNLAVKYNCLFLFLHHTGKRTEKLEPNKNNLLGGQGFEAKVRLVMELRMDLTDPSIRHLCIVKGNYLPSNAKQESFVLHFDEGLLLFTNTGKRIPFDLLARKEDSAHFKDKYDSIVRLKNLGVKYDDIAKKMGVGSKGTITRWLKKGESLGYQNESFDFDIKNLDDLEEE